MLIEKIDLSLPPFLAIDEKDTHVSEDAIRFIDYGDLKQLQIIAVVPYGLNLPTYMYESALQNISDCFNIKKEKRSLFSAKYRRKFSLSNKTPMSVISATFVLNKRYITRDFSVEIPKTPLVTTLSALVDKIDYDSYREKNLRNMISICAFVTSYLETTGKTHLKSRAKKLHVTNREWQTRALLDLFNHACRVKCREMKVPYYNLNIQTKEIWVNDGHAIFNKPLRNYLSYVNSLNLFAALNEQKIPFQQEPMVKFLNQRFKVIIKE